MSLKLADTPNEHELDRLAAITPADEDRAVGVWNRRSKLPGLLAAGVDENAGDVDGPIADNEQ